MRKYDIVSYLSANGMKVLISVDSLPASIYKFLHKNETEWITEDKLYLYGTEPRTSYTPDWLYITNNFKYIVR